MAAATTPWLDHVVWLDDAPDQPSLGGKGRMLARLTAAGLPVPPGFVLCADALPAEPPARADAMRLPDAVAAALALAYAELGRRLGEDEPLVAVRSSGLAEDLAQASFAGQYATVLGVRGAADVLTAVARCWASLWSPGVAAYRAEIERRTGAALPPPGMAVVVQALVPASAAGVADTADAAGGARDVVAISASWGLGRSVVDGAVRPDCWRVLRDGLHVVQFNAGDKAARAGLGLDAAPEPVPEALRRRPCLTLEQAADVAALALKAEAVVNAEGGADVEWAFDGDRLWLLQARPLTGRVAAQAAARQDGRVPASGPSGPTPAFPFAWPDTDAPRWHWSRDAEDGRAFGVIRPFELDSLRQFYQAIEQAAHLLGSRQHTRSLEVNGRLYYARVPNPEDEPSRERQAESFLRPVRALHKRGESLFEAVVKPAMQADMRRYGALKPDLFSAPELAAHLEEMMRWYEHVFVLHFTHEPWDELGPSGPLASLYCELTGDENRYAVYAPLDHAPSKEYEAVDGLIEMARIARARPALLALFERATPEQVWRDLGGVDGGGALRKRLDAFLDVFGLQCGASNGGLMGQLLPGWGEEPALVIALIQRYLSQDLDALALARQRSKDQYERDARQLRERMAGAGASAEQLAQFDFWFDATRRMVLGALEHNYYLDSPPNALLHRALMACGRRLVAAGALDDGRDVWWLRSRQIAAALRGLDAPEPRPDWRALVAAHKAEFEWQRSLTAPSYLGSPPPAAEPLPLPDSAGMPPAPAKALVKGVGAAPGVATGRVRLIDLDALVPDVSAGDVFVAANCGALWAAVLPVVGAVVLDGSHPYAHAMRMCREFGVPAVVQAVNATAVLREGQRVTVDGGRGWITS